jgi:hypothetical protein
MPCCYHHCQAPWLYWDWLEPYRPSPRRYTGPPSDAYIQHLEDERSMLVQRLRCLEQELAELRRRGRSSQV